MKRPDYLKDKNDYMTYQEFKQLPPQGYNEFISKGVQCINQNEYCFLTVQKLIEACEENGMYDKIKFGDEAEKNNSFPIPDMVGLTPQSHPLS